MRGMNKLFKEFPYTAAPHNMETAIKTLQGYPDQESCMSRIWQRALGLCKFRYDAIFRIADSGDMVECVVCEQLAEACRESCVGDFPNKDRKIRGLDGKEPGLLVNKRIAAGVARRLRVRIQLI